MSSTHRSSGPGRPSRTWLGAVLTAAATAYWIAVIGGGNDVWAAFAFTFGIAMPLGAGILFFGLLPSVSLYRRTKERRDWTSLLLTGCALTILLVEVVVINVIRQRGE